MPEALYDRNINNFSRNQSIDERRAGYLASVVLAGNTETRVQVEEIMLEGLTLRVVSPLNASGALPTVIYYHSSQRLPCDCGAVSSGTGTYLASCAP